MRRYVFIFTISFLKKTTSTSPLLKKQITDDDRVQAEIKLNK
jgi:hypothetical protein